MRTDIENQLGKAWDEWRRTRTTHGFLWYTPHGGVGSLVVSDDERGELVTGQDVGWLSREQFMARMTPICWRIPLLDANGN
jgi:hypothetical protein